MKRHQFEVTVNVLTPRPMTDRSDCETALRALCACASLAPEYVDVTEPIREPFDCNRIDAVIDTVWQWQKGPDTFMWRRRKPKSWGGIYMSKSPEPVHGKIDLESAAGSPDINTELARFLTTTATALGADFGLVDATPTKADGSESCVAVTTWDLRKGLPDLYWGTVFGKPYVELFGRDRLSDVPAAVKVELSPNLFYIQLTDRLNDVIERPEVVDQARQAVKEHLGLDAFVIARGAATAARLPTFSFAAPQPAVESTT